MTREEAMTVITRLNIITTGAPSAWIEATIRIVQAAAAAEREACAEIAEKEIRNTAMLTSNPPKSAAAWDIRNAIRARDKA